MNIEQQDTIYEMMRERIEPAANIPVELQGGYGPSEGEIMTSLAISAKRQADALERIADSLLKLSTPLITVEEPQP